jgi:hypothetical protein
MSARFFRHRPKLRQDFQRICTAADRHPAVAIRDRPLGSVWKAAPDDDRWVRPLRRLWPLHHFVELDENSPANLGVGCVQISFIARMRSRIILKRVSKTVS